MNVIERYTYLYLCQNSILLKLKTLYFEMI